MPLANSNTPIILNKKERILSLQYVKWCESGVLEGRLGAAFLRLGLRDNQPVLSTHTPLTA